MPRATLKQHAHNDTEHSGQPVGKLWKKLVENLGFEPPPPLLNVDLDIPSERSRQLLREHKHRGPR